MSPGIGPRMAEATEFVLSNPGCRKVRAAEYVAPHGTLNGLRHGYRAVANAIRHGLLAEEPGRKSNAVTLVATEKGEELVRTWTSR